MPSRCLSLYTTLERVTAANERDYNSFPGEGKVYDAQDNFTGNAGTARAALNETRLLQRLPLKEKMPVMLIQNLNVQGGWVNGTIAQIEYLEDDNIRLRKTSNNSNSVQIYWIQRISRQVQGTSYVRTQYPLVPAFAATIHKSQSLTIDRVAIHLDHMATHGQMYVAMSRVRRPEDLYFFNADLPLKIKRKFGADVDAVEVIRKRERR